MDKGLSQGQIERVVAFHGHECPGLWVGMRAAELCCRELGVHRDDDPLVAVVETDMCGVDAIQVLTGCTLGKGNLIHRDYGKTAFSFQRRSTGRGLRAVFCGDFLGEAGRELRELMKKIFAGEADDTQRQRAAELKRQNRQRLMAADLDELFTVSESPATMPSPARILESLICSSCGESTMESRTRRLAGKHYCIPCFSRVDQKL
ncbi:FmdE family protein [Desulfurivibrio alkaliphilus]|uniref:Formylmethanofuran dehydrogenase subunit E region n=1 Tax=Desulfurivibrio alkaliphilus (strain DSM 19089 / UNIQEM U267 / AHT2) TaxID=589865 RepID=D6Z3Z5_DESAT|nr:FmdE family protein [Desulfurivibrio alkaliphilus]ADH86270.1 formylmethanofuran dehydrogenase subunit E region [Desulfurivibrio alkaliphilus AHT 2]